MRSFVSKAMVGTYPTARAASTMIEHPKIGEGVDVELREGMVFSMHPHAITEGASACMYMQDTWCIGADAGEPLSSVPLKLFDGTEPRPDT